VCFANVANVYSTQLNIALGADLFAYGICSTIISLLDLLITYSRYKMLSLPMCPHEDIVVGAYVFLLIVCTTLPFYTLVPLFVAENDNDGPGLEALNSCLYYIYAPAVTLFNATFAGWFWVRIIGWRVSSVGKMEQHPRMLVLAYKSAVHAVIR
jgi:hypothetical protein